MQMITQYNLPVGIVIYNIASYIYFSEAYLINVSQRGLLICRQH